MLQKNPERKYDQSKISPSKCKRQIYDSSKEAVTPFGYDYISLMTKKQCWEFLSSQITPDIVFNWNIILDNSPRAQETHKAKNLKRTAFF